MSAGITGRIAGERSRGGVPDDGDIFLTAVVASADSAIIGRTLEGIVTGWNAGAARMFGYSAEEMVGQTIRRIVPPDHAFEEDIVNIRVMQGERISDFETVRCRKDGSRFEATLKVVPVYSVDNTIIGASMLVNDITERRRSEKQTRRLNWALEAYANSSVALIHAESLDTLSSNICNALVAKNRYALAWIGIAEDREGKPITPLARAGSASAYLDGLELSWSAEHESGQGPGGVAVRNGHAEFMRDSMTDPRYGFWRRRALSFGIRSTITVPFKRRGGVIGVIAVYASEPDAFGAEELDVFERLGGEISFAVGVFEDRARLAASETARHEAELALAAAQAEFARAGRLVALGEVTASIAHEVNQPLAAIAMNSGTSLRWLEKDDPDVAEALKAIRRIKRDADRAADVIARTRALLATGDARRSRCALNDIVRDVVAFTQADARLADVELRARLPERSPFAWVDKTQLQQVLLNLVSNAIEAMRGVDGRPRRLDIECRPDASGEIEIAVSDTGKGFDPETAAHLFDRFYTTRPGGVGLGLSISRSIVEAHGGRLWAEPNTPHGAVFRFTLPAADGAPP